MTVFQKRAFGRAILGLTSTYIRVQLVNREGLPGDYLAHEIAHGDNALERHPLKLEGAENDADPSEPWHQGQLPLER